jgi:glycosyltransferase involved in cell wall biosynthesis
LREADEAAAGRLVYLAHTPQFLPFGPESWSRDAHATSRVRDAAAVIVIGHHMAGYVREHAGMEARVIHPATYGFGPFESYSNFHHRRALMINPCAVKGITIFADIARLSPDINFAALGGWGTTGADRATLASIPNVTMLEPVSHIEQVLEQTSVLLMPSLWYEGFGLIVMEAMLRGIPVISSDSGGLAEAKQGTGFVIPVQPIRQYLAAFDDVHMPRPVIPRQDLEPWAESLRALLGSAECYERESERARNAAVDFVYSLKTSAMEDLLLALHPKQARKGADLTGRIEKLSPDQKALLLAKLKARARG